MKANLFRVEGECAEAFHVAEYVEGEMAARGWDRDELATRMLPVEHLSPLNHHEWGLTRLALDMFLEVREPGVLIGTQAEQFARAFGTSPELWRNLHNAWRNHSTTRAAFPEFFAGRDTSTLDGAGA